MEPEAAAERLEKVLRGFRGDLTIADAATRSGLALRDAESGLHTLVSRFNGHLASTEKGELLFRFPKGLVQPPEKRWYRRALRRVGRTVAGVGRFILRAWVSVVLIGYVAVFAAVLIAMALRSDRDDGIGDGIAILTRIVFEALFWTFHPFSPFYGGWGSRELDRGLGRRRKPKGLRFYEKVNRFVFGPVGPPEDPKAERKALLAAIRRNAGRIGLADVVRVTGLDRGEADARMSRLLLDYNGDIDISPDGALVYRFEALRQTAADKPQTPQPRPFWRDTVKVPAITGNDGGTNALLVALNGFNLLASSYALSNGLTIERLVALIGTVSRDASERAVMLPPPDGLPWALGVVPFVFSGAVFALPIVRMVKQSFRKQKADAENGRRALAALVLDAPKPEYPAAALEAVWAEGAGRKPQEKELLSAVQSLGGRFDINDDGDHLYRFDELVRERKALTDSRAKAGRDEASPGEIVFSSDA